MSSTPSRLLAALCLFLAACGVAQSSPAASKSASPLASPVVVASANPSSVAVACTGTTTPAVTEGPFFKAGSSEHATLVEAGMAGTRLTLTGRVLGTDCQPVVRALIDVWQADASGNYDNSGYRLRGHVVTDATGNYRINTIIPGLYTGRTEHIHVKVQAPGGPLLTTQLFFPGVPQNDSDGIYNGALLLKMSDGGAGKAATFDFIVARR